MGKPILTALALLGVLSLMAGCGSGDPFDYVEVSGKVTYEDGELIPAKSLRVTFHPQSDPIDAQTYPRSGVVTVNPSDGTFSDVSSYRYGDGIVVGRHKVTFSARNRSSSDPRLIPLEYTKLETTPLEIDAADTPFDFKIPRPVVRRGRR